MKGHRGVAGPGRGKKMFDAQQVERIRDLVSSGLSMRRVAQLFGCSKATVSNYAWDAPTPTERRQYLVARGAGL